MQLVEAAPVGAPSAAAPSTPASAFDKAAYIDQLRQASDTLTALRGATEPEEITRKQVATIKLMGLVKIGLEHARSAMPKEQLPAFVGLLQKVMAAHGLTMPASNAQSSAQPPSVPPVAAFAGGTPDFMSRWNHSDPGWQMMQCASRKVGEHVYITGIAKLNDNEHMFFHGVAGGDIKLKSVGPQQANAIMDEAMQKGFSPMAPQDLGASIGSDHVRMMMSTPAWKKADPVITTYAPPPKRANPVFTTSDFKPTKHDPVFVPSNPAKPHVDPTYVSTEVDRQRSLERDRMFNQMTASSKAQVRRW